MKNKKWWLNYIFAPLAVTLVGGAVLYYWLNSPNTIYGIHNSNVSGPVVNNSVVNNSFNTINELPEPQLSFDLSTTSYDEKSGNHKMVFNMVLKHVSGTFDPVVYIQENLNYSKSYFTTCIITTGPGDLIPVGSYFVTECESTHEPKYLETQKLFWISAE